jgi:hypothetical protein
MLSKEDIFPEYKVIPEAEALVKINQITGEAFNPFKSEPISVPLV